MAPASLLSDVGGDYCDWGSDYTDYSYANEDYGPIQADNPKVDDIPKYELERWSSVDDDDDDVYDDDDDDDDDDHKIEKLSLEDKLAAYRLHDLYRWEPFGSYLTRQYYNYSAPPYFKRDHPDDNLFLKELGDAQVQVPWRTQLEYPKHADELLIKDVVALIIWQDTKHKAFWNNLREMSPPDQDDSLYSHIIRVAASLVSFFYTQANLFKIGHERTLDKQMDIIFTKAEQWDEKGTSLDGACELLMQHMADKDEFSFVTENDLADIPFSYANDIRTRKFKRPSTIWVPFPPTDKDQLFHDITEVVRKAELPPAQLTAGEADEYTHWMMTLLREEVSQVELRLISRAMGEHPMPLFTLCNLHRYKVCAEISETVQVADLRRMSLGSRFIGRSHLIWAFYKLGYALPLEIRNTINVFDSDEDHPPYHIYMAALKLALRSGEKKMQLDHFVFAVLHSKDIDFDGERAIEFYQDFRDFQKALESMETEIEPKSTVTVRPCGSLDIFFDSRDDSHDTEEHTTTVEPKSSENLSTDSGDAEDSITNTGRIYSK
ncbi:uncharacterized protein LOC141606107 isoform X2 [Silene latifolia]|uniref:uncharacterized protein LOC141606107 isoform X2 n=1 Tax=Silene latifolia TaxID=37657 RepID=UPI003D774365